jgi:hypothetical protein
MGWQRKMEPGGVMTRWVCLATLVGAGCDGNNLGGNVLQDTSAGGDLDGPVITHTAISASQLYGEDVLLEAQVTDAHAVFTVEVSYQQQTAAPDNWKSAVMTEVGGGLFQGAIPGGDVGSGGMRYFLQAWDELENASCLPDRCDEDAFRFGVVPG